MLSKLFNVKNQLVVCVFQLLLNELLSVTQYSFFCHFSSSFRVFKGEFKLSNNCKVKLLKKPNLWKFSPCHYGVHC